jgi:DNA-binding NtrC family response regulator
MKENVMVVDDDESVRETLNDFFRSEGFESIAVETGDKCIKLLQNDFRGVILLDILMPGMDAWETIRNIVEKGLTDHILIFLLTALKEPPAKMEPYKQFVIDYCVKPCDLDKLSTDVRQYLKYIK